MASEASDPQSPLVSIICRTMGRPELKQALAAAAGQTHAPLEIILVDAAARGGAACQKDSAGVPATLALPDAPLTRPAAANFGLDRAQGEYLLFLDEDDWLAPDHIEHLLAFLENQRKVRAAYSSTRKTDAAGQATIQTFAQPFDRLLLMRDNYIPIHSMLFARSLLDGAGCRFDESFAIYEDWDFWLQLSERGDFRHIDHCTAFYRAGGASGTGDLDDHLRRFDSDHNLGKARAAVYNKWLKRWSGGQLNALLGEGQRELAQSAARIAELGRELENLAAAKRNTEQQLAEARLSLTKMEARLQAANAELVETARHLQNLLGSRSWKMTHPYRALGRWFASLSGKTPPPPLSLESLRLPGKAPHLQSPHHNGAWRRPESAQAKAAFDREARQTLAGFLASGKKLSVPAVETPALSVLLVFFNQAQLSLLCLQALIENADVPFELIIVDNASSDETGELLDRLENIKLIRNDENLGFVKAVNQGAALAGADHLLLLNNDAFIEPGALGAALETLREEVDAGAVGGRIQTLDGRLQEAGNIIWRDGSCAGYGRGGNPEDGEFRFRRDVDYCSGAFLLFATALFKELGGFDEDFAPAYYEESDFCLRLRQRGLRTIYEPRAVLRHYEFASTGGIEAATAQQNKNRERFRQKHHEFLQGQPEANPKRSLFARTANRWPNVLIIDDMVPDASFGSGYPRCKYIVNQLSKFPVNLTFYPLIFPNEDWGAVYQTIPENIEVILNKGISGLADFLIERSGFYKHVMISRATNMKIFNETFGFLPNLARKFEIIYDAEAIISGRDILQRELHGEYFSDEKKSEIFSKELSLADNASVIVTVSSAEEELFQKHRDARTVVLGHGITPKKNSTPFNNRHGILFVGSLRHESSPNVDSLQWFAHNVLPFLEKEISTVDLQVVGELGAHSLVTIEKKNIHFQGRLESLDELYRSCRIFIAPTRFAAGIPHKVHEAAANGIPSVVTPLLATQLGWQHEGEVLVAKEPEQFALACIRLYQDKDLWNSLVKSAREAVLRDCSEERVKDALLNIFGLN